MRSFPMWTRLSAALLLGPAIGLANAAEPAAPRTQRGTVEIDGVAHDFLLAPGGQRVAVLLHGWGAQPAVWEPVIVQLVAEGYTVLAPNLPELAGVPRRLSADERDRIVEELHALIARLDLGPGIGLVGRNVGGTVAYAYAAQHPGEVLSLSLLDAPLPAAAQDGRTPGTSFVSRYKPYRKC